MARVGLQPFRMTQAEFATFPIVDGQLIFITDEGANYIYLDVGDRRKAIGPAIGGDASTLGGRPANKFVYNDREILSGQNILTYADTIESLNVVKCRGQNCQGVPTNYGYTEANNDFWYEINVTTKATFISIVARDVRTNSTFMNTKTSGNWQGWTRFNDGGNANTLGGKFESDFVQYSADGSVFAKKQGNEGGQIIFEKGTDSSLFGSPWLDLIGDKLRFVVPKSTGGHIITEIPIAEPKTDNGNNVAIFRSGTADITAGVTNIGKNVLYIKYKA